MKLRLPELLAERGMTAYAFAKAVGPRVSQSTAYRLARGEWKSLSGDVMDVICDALDVEPGELFERTRARRGRQSGPRRQTRI
jgi:DNA-binding Xre family transcriptional regulator